jgi:anti-sigma-K factor RskA
MNDHDRFRDDCGAYVLGALEQPEAAALREHLDSCVICRDDVDRLNAVVEVLGLGVPMLSPPAELRARVLDVVRGEAALFEQAAPRAAPRRRRVPTLRPLAGFAGAALALGIVLGALVIAPGSSSTRVVSAAVAPASRWHAARAPVAVLRESGSQGELVLSDLPPAPSGRIYEVWIRRGGRPQPTSVLFDATSGGSATVAVPDLADASAVMVTAERLGGARVPTMKPLIVAQLS